VKKLSYPSETSSKLDEFGELLDKFEMKSCNSVSNPSETNSKLDECIDEERVDSTMFRQIVGSLRYLCNNRPNICY